MANFSGLFIEMPTSVFTGIPWEYLPESTRLAAQPYESIILEAVNDFGKNVDRDLCLADEDWLGFPAFLIPAMIQVESNGINSVHPSGAVGLMGINIEGLTQEKLLDPRINIRVGALMLCQIMNNHYRFQADGDIDTALAMYNAGDTAILEGKPLLPGEGYEYSDRVYYAAGFDEKTIQAIRWSRHLKAFTTPTPPIDNQIK